jgi:hypothetical protein
VADLAHSAITFWPSGAQDVSTGALLSQAPGFGRPPKLGDSINRHANEVSNYYLKLSCLDYLGHRTSILEGKRVSLLTFRWVIVNDDPANNQQH